MDFASLPAFLLCFLSMPKNWLVKSSLCFYLFILLSGCGEGNPVSRFGTDLIDFPEDEFAEEYVLADFTLDQDYDYWEIRSKRLFSLVGEDDDSRRESVWEQYDDEAYSELNSIQLEILTDITSDNGLSETVGSMGRSISYVVALRGYSPLIIDSVVDLTEFFDEVDTEAELWVRLKYTKDYISISGTSGYITPLTYEEVLGGYRVLIQWDTQGGTRGRDIVLVSPDGSIKKLEELWRGTGAIAD